MSNWQIKVSLFLNYFVFAILLNSVGTVILQVQGNYGISEGLASVLEAFKDLSIAGASFLLASYITRIGYKNAMLIPQNATFEILDKTYVYVVNKDNQLAQRLITVAAELPHVFVVKSGLKASDKILLEGLRKVHNGQTIAVNFKAPEQVLSQLALHAE